MNKGRISRYGVLAVVLASGTLLLTACPNPQQEQSLTQIQSQISVLSNEMKTSFEKSGGEQADLYKKLNEDINVLTKNQADATATNDQLTSELAVIQAKIDEYNTRMEQLGERLSSTETTFTERITAISQQLNELGGKRSASTPRPMPPQPPPVNPVNPGTSTLPPLNPNAPETGLPLESADSEGSNIYHTAYTEYVNGNFENAISGFQKYLQASPDKKLADVAQFWIAESYFSLGEYDTSLQEYGKVIDQYPSSDKVSAAYLGKADAYLKIDRQIEAVSHLKYIVKQFPDSVAAQKAAEKLRALGEQ